MTLLRIVVFLAFSFLLLFYPGQYWITQTFANRALWATQTEVPKLRLHPIPVVDKAALYPAISAQGAFIADLSSFTPIFEHNSKQRFYPASTTKIISALVVADVFKPTDIIVVNKSYTKESVPDWQIMGLTAGERITVENLLYGMLVYSANDAAETVAEAYGYDAFINLMNKKALELGMHDSHFTNPIGLDNATQLTSPYDLALAGRALLQNPYLLKFVSTKEITISDVDYKYFHQLTNLNQLLGEVSGIGGLKTGYTELAGENLVSYYKKNGHQYIIVALKSVDRFADTKTLTDWINTNVHYVSMPTN